MAEKVPWYMVHALPKRKDLDDVIIALFEKIEGVQHSDTLAALQQPGYSCSKNGKIVQK